jgi:hypothetical protein
MPVILVTQEAEIRRITVRGQPWQIVFKTLSQKLHNTTRNGRVAKVLEQMSSKHEALSSNPILQTKQNKKQDSGRKWFSLK